MTSLDNSTPEYGWQDAEATNAHSYLLPCLLKILGSLTLDKPKIFDAGCGNGFIAGKLLTNGYEVVGCDASELGIQEASKKYPHGKFEVASLYDDLEKKFGSDWEIVISSEVVEHLYDPRLFAKNMFKLLKPGGSLVISAPYHGYLKNLAIAVVGKFDGHFTVLWDGGHIKFWSYRTLKALLQEAGFENFSFHGAGRFPWLWKSMVVLARKPK